MSSFDFRELRHQTEQVKQKLNNGQKVTAAEVETLRQYAQRQPSGATIGLYAIAKRSLVEDDTKNE